MLDSHFGIDPMVCVMVGFVFIGRSYHRRVGLASLYYRSMCCQETELQRGDGQDESMSIDIEVIRKLI